MSTDLVSLAAEHHRAGRWDAAERLYRQALRELPGDASALHLLGLLLHQTGRTDESLPLLRRSVTSRPHVAHFRSNLAAVLGRAGRTEEALEHLREAVRLAPDLPEAYNNLGVALESLGQLDVAIEAHRAALLLRPDYAECHNNLGHALQQAGPASLAAAAYRRAIELRPDYHEAHANLATALGETGVATAAVASYRRALELRPEASRVHSDLLVLLHYCPEVRPDQLFEEHVRWADRHARPLYPRELAHDNEPSPDRRLRVGYVSAEFRCHPVSRFFEPILSAHDGDQFEIFCYSDVKRSDGVTARLRGLADAWREVKPLSDERLARQVRDDRIDVLVDLAGHMSDHRLLTFARKPAPVQVTYLGYPDTTGLAAMDYRITDSRHDPPGLTECYHTEQLVRLDPCCWCYRPDDDAPEVSEPPLIKSGSVTFGAMNKLVKVNPQTLRLWSQILDRVPRSRLMVLVGPRGSADPAVREMLAAHGIGADRLALVERGGRREYLSRYAAVDVALDSFPYNGHTTTCDALWMGVPVVTLAGRTHASRAGVSVLSSMGLLELIAGSTEGYVDIALALAHDHARLSRLRRGMRERMRSSPLFDGTSLAGRLEGAYRNAWTHWCNCR